MIIDLLLAISLACNVCLLYRYGALLVRNRNTEIQLEIASQCLVRESIKKAMNAVNKPDKMRELNKHREN